MRKFVFFVLFAFVSTPLLIFSGADWAWAKWSEQLMFLQYLAIPSVFIGILAPLVLLVWYAAKPAHRAALVQVGKAFGWAFLLSTVLKSMTNRMAREPFEVLGALDFSTYFRFGFLQGANWWESLIEGYPSGHTLTAFAMVFALLPFLPPLRWKRLAIGYALYMGLGVSLTVHWLSDVVTGAFLGMAIGHFYANSKPQGRLKP